MLTAAGCRSRRERFLERIRPTQPLLLGDPLHLRYLANFHSDPFSLGGDFGGLLLLHPDGCCKLFHDNRLFVPAARQAHADSVEILPWYDGQSPGRGPRRLLLRDVVRNHGGHIHDALNDPQCQPIIEVLADMRRAKDDDETAILRRCMRATDAGHAWARAHVQPGMTELDVYNGIARACTAAAGQAVIVYGDFIVSDGPDRRVGPATDRVLNRGDTLILDFSVVLWGYRSDFTNTLVIGGLATAEQERLMDCCQQALAAGERELRAGNACQMVYGGVVGSFERNGVANLFPHHAGHGLGLTHPEAPYFTKGAHETLVAGDVVTLEPGLYIPGTCGMRIERNYLITDSGFECLSGHQIGLT